MLSVLRMSDNVTSLRLFVRVARAGSFSSVAREVGMSQSSVSRIIASLEKEVGASLFTRNTHAVVLSEKGADYLTRIEPIIDALDEANHAARGTGELRGTLRVGLPSSLAVRHVIPALPGFMAAHPHLHVDLRMEDRFQDLVRDGVDVAIRLGPLADSTATSRLIGLNPRLIAASPDYLARRGTPTSPEDLVRHSVIVGPVGSAASAWTFERDGRTLSIRIDPVLTVSQNEGAVAAAAAGLGIISTAYWGCRRELEAGSLVAILDGWTMPPGEIHAVYPAGRAAKIAARQLIDYLGKELSARR
jgi:DNA-binding transcriptional LysR family regulator